MLIDVGKCSAGNISQSKVKAEKKNNLRIELAIKYFASWSLESK
jgi:hypothetical protein